MFYRPPTLGEVHWDPEHPGRRPSASEVTLTGLGLLLFLALIVWGTWTVGVWTNNKVTWYDIGMPAVLCLLGLASRATWHRAMLVRTQAIEASHRSGRENRLM